MVDRIREIIKYSQMSQQDFAARISASAASLSNILNGKTNPSTKTVQGIHFGFPEINVNWLMFGDGNMLAGIMPNLPDANGETASPEVPSGGLFSEVADSDQQPDDVQPQQTGLPLWVYLVIGAAVVVVVVVIIVVVRKKKKAAALAKLEEGNDEDI